MVIVMQTLSAKAISLFIWVIQYILNANRSFRVHESTAELFSVNPMRSFGNRTKAFDLSPVPLTRG